MLSLIFAPFFHSRLIGSLLWREIRSRTHGTLFGWLWILLQPGLQVFAYWFLIDFVLKVRSPGQVVFINYFLVAMIPWILISDCLTRNAFVYTEYAAIFQRTIFPLSVLPWVPLLLSGIIYGPILVFTCLFLMGWMAALSALVLMALLVIFLMPISYIISLVGLYFKEVRQALPFLLTILLYVTPILYMPESLPSAAKWITSYNIMADVIALFEGWMNGLPLEAMNYIRPGCFWLLSLLLAVFIFKRSEPHLREEL